MTENAKKSAAQNTIEDPPEYNAENAKNPKEGTDWLGGPQNGNENPDKPKIMSDASEYIGQYLLGALQNAKLQTDLIGDLVNLTQTWVNRGIDDAQYSEQLRQYSMAIG